MVIHSKLQHEINDIRIGLNIENIINITNQFAYHIAQDVTKSNRYIVCISTIEKISNNRIFKSDYDQSN
jgi:hypothetical protein